MGRQRGREERPAGEEARAGGYRHARLQQILKEELDALVRDELGDPRLDGVHITTLELSVDYKNARVGFILERARERTREERERAERGLAHATPFLRSRLVESVDLKVVPALRFVWDRDAAEAPEDFTRVAPSPSEDDG